MRWWRDTRWLDSAAERAADFAADGLSARWFGHSHSCVNLASGGSVGMHSALEWETRRPPGASASTIARMLETDVIVGMIQAGILPNLGVGKTDEYALRHLHPEWAS